MIRFAPVLLLALATQVLAAEGMWQPRQLPALEAQMRKAGIAVDPARLADLTRYPMNAVVSLGGFCSASFVSPLGLILTNHHCAYGSIQFNSSTERNLLRDGFLAPTLGEELRAEPSLRVYVTESIADVSAKVRAGLDAKMSGRARFDAIDRVQKSLVRECESDADHRCEVYAFHGGVEYFLVRQLQLRDVRLVYAPASAIGDFGGDVDNWIWPRHAGDFAYYRAYVGPDGKPADYSESNVPYRPASHLTLQPAGLKEGDFAMVVGYPGRSNRHRLAQEVADAIDWQYPSLIARYQKILALVKEHSQDSADAAIKYAGYLASMNNGLKNFQANLEGLGRIEAVGRKQGEEALIQKWANAHHQQAGVLGAKALRAQLVEQRASRDRDQLLQLLSGSVMYAAVRDVQRLALERQKSPLEREYGYQPRDEARIEARLAQVDRRYDPKVDRALLAYLLGELMALPAAQRIPELDRWVAGGDGEPTAAQLSTRLDALYAGTRVGDGSVRAMWFKADRKTIEAVDDPALALARALYPALQRIEEQSKSWQGEESRNRAAWMTTRLAYAAAQGKQLYADANASLRVSFGTVRGYSPRAGEEINAFTDLTGIVARHTGKEPFDAPRKQLEAIGARRFGPYAVGESVPVNFVADLDITGGNSGSPVLNGRAELVGLAFDMNYEGVSSGWLFNASLNRAIAVDVRYMLWVMDALDGAQHLLTEMGIQPAFTDAPR